MIILGLDKQRSVNFLWDLQMHVASHLSPLTDILSHGGRMVLGVSKYWTGSFIDWLCAVAILESCDTGMIWRPAGGEQRINNEKPAGLHWIDPRLQQKWTVSLRGQWGQPMCSKYIYADDIVIYTSLPWPTLFCLCLHKGAGCPTSCLLMFFPAISGQLWTWTVSYGAALI